MKKLFIVILTLFISQNVYSLEVYNRTDEDLRVHESITITPSNKYDILKTPSVNEKEKVYDFANLLTEHEEQTLYKKINEFINNYNMDLVLVTTLDNWTDAKNYADNFYDYNYFGIGNTFDGILLLIDMDNREIWMSTTGNAILVYSDARIDNILDDMYYYISDAKYFETFDTGIDSVADYAKVGIPSENKDSYIDENGDYHYVEHKEFPILIFIGISSVVATIVLIIFINKNKLVRKAHDAKEYIEQENKKVGIVSNHKISSHTSRMLINTDSGSSSFGGSRGSSTHRSSSGRSHGGGGRRF